MTPTTEIARQLEESLGELENAHNISAIGIRVEDTADPSFGQLKNTFCSGFMCDDLRQTALLAYIEYFNTRREIVLSLTTPQINTTIKEDRPVTWEVEEIAKGFCKTHGLIPDLIKCLNQAEVIFSNIQNLVAEYDCFQVDDYKEDGHIVIRVEVDSDQKTVFQEYNIWTDWMLDNISDDKLDYFILTVSRT